MSRSLNEELWPDPARCFARGLKNEIGPELICYERAGTVISQWEPPAAYEGWAGMVHGGMLTVALDELAWFAAVLAIRRRDGDEEPFMVTAEYTVRFRSPVRVRRALDCSARVIEFGDHHAVVEAGLEAEGTEVVSMVARYVKLAEPPAMARRG